MGSWGGWGGGREKSDFRAYPLGWTGGGQTRGWEEGMWGDGSGHLRVVLARR